MEHLSQYPGLGLEGRGEELRRLAMVEWTFVGCALMNTRGGGGGGVGWIKILIPLNRAAHLRG